MKNLKKILASLTAVFMMLVCVGSANVFAQTKDSEQGGSGSIIISNAAKGETYTVYLLFEATLGNYNEIAYKGTVPPGLENYFEETSTGSGYVQAKPAAFKEVTYYTDETKTTPTDSVTDYWSAMDGSEMSEGLKTALTTWKETATAAATVVSDGSTLTFSNLVLGYYVVTTSQGEQVISVDSTMPSVTITDKNTTTITAGKVASDTNVSIGQTVTYTATFDTTTYIGNEQVKSYTISDTLPSFLDDVKIISVKVVETPAQEADGDNEAVEEVSTNLSSSYTAFTTTSDGNKQIVIPWVRDDGTTSLYKNGAQIVIKYTATVTGSIVIDGEAGNVNRITITPNKDKDGGEPFEEHYSDEEKIYTYAAALKKVDGKTNAALAGAEFTITGLTATKIKDGVYKVDNYYSSGTDKDGNAITPTTLTTDDNGQLVILGIASDETLVVTETKAPDGYNKLTTTTSLTPYVTGEAVTVSSRDIYYDENGNVIEDKSQATTTVVEYSVTDNTTFTTALFTNSATVENNKGSELPSTGGMGTTILYVAGGILILGAAIFFVTNKRMQKN